MQMWVYPQDEIESHRQELQQSVFELWSVLPGKEPCGYFQWLHGPLWRPREQAQPSLRRWVNDNGKAPVRRWSDGYVPVPLLKKHCLDTGKDEHIDGPIPREWFYGKAPSFVSESQLAQARRKEREKQWLNQFAESAKAQERESKRRRHLHKNFGSMVLF